MKLNSKIKVKNDVFITYLANAFPIFLPRLLCIHVRREIFSCPGKKMSSPKIGEDISSPLKNPGAIGDWGNGYGEKLTMGMSGEGRNLTSLWKRK